MIAGLGLAGLFCACRSGTSSGAVKTSGILEATQIRVSAATPGRVLSLRAGQGLDVAAGDTLALLDPENSSHALRQADALLSIARSQLELLSKGAREEDRAQADAAARSARLALKTAENDAGRVQALFATGGATARQRDEVEARLALVRAQAEAAEQTLAKLVALARPEELAAAQARVDQAQAARDLAARALAECAVTSPVSGTVLELPMAQGELAGPGAVLALVVRLDTLHLDVYLTEQELAGIRLDSRAEVRISSLGRTAVAARVSRISPAAEFTPQNVQTREERAKLVYAVRLVVPNPDRDLRPGMSAEAIVRPAESR
jgi:HlyD family secretion protein